MTTMPDEATVHRLATELGVDPVGMRHTLRFRVVAGLPRGLDGIDLGGHVAGEAGHRLRAGV
jgi:hypothetical protein